MRKLLAVALLLGVVGIVGAAELKSGLQPGDAPPAFNVLDVTGPSAGEKLCYRCQYGNRPVVSIFTRKIDGNVAKLIKDVDGVVGKNGDKKMAAFVVLLSDDIDGAEKALTKLAKKNGIKHVPLTVYEGAAGPGSYKVSEKADVTVMMWVESDVKVNYAFGKDELKKDKVAGVVADTAKILE